MSVKLLPVAMFGLALLAAPFLRSIINRVKARFGGRQGPRLLQPYYDLYKLFRKSTVYSQTVGWVFKVAPLFSFIALLGALLIAPQLGGGAVISFSGDLFVFIGLFALARFFTVAAALDTGSALCGMGASRDAFYSALAEPSLLLGLGGLALASNTTSLAAMYEQTGSGEIAGELAPGIIFLILALFLIYLVENCRLPFDDSATHLELTMIHEATILDYGGFDLGIIEYTGALKLWTLGLLLINLLVLPSAPLLAIGALGLLAVSVGIIESTMARSSLPRVPMLLAIALVLTLLWIMWTLLNADRKTDALFS